MKPYNWIPKYSNVWELKHDSTIGNKKAARQHAKDELALDIVEYYDGKMHLEMSDFWNKIMGIDA